MNLACGPDKIHAGKFTSLFYLNCFAGINVRGIVVMAYDGVPGKRDVVKCEWSLF